jgi:hypothetical protein
MTEISWRVERPKLVKFENCPWRVVGVNQNGMDAHNVLQTNNSPSDHGQTKYTNGCPLGALKACLKDTGLWDANCMTFFGSAALDHRWL